MPDHHNVWVELSHHDMLFAAIGGCQRRVKAMQVNRPQLYGADHRQNYWQIDVQGAIAEYAVAKAINMFWEPATDQPLNTLPGDVGVYQVRSTVYKSGSLIVHPADKDDAAFILAIVAEPFVKLAGYLWGKDAKQLGEYKKPKDIWVDQTKLKPVTDILHVVETETVRIKKRHTPNG